MKSRTILLLVTPLLLASCGGASSFSSPSSEQSSSQSQSESTSKESSSSESSFSPDGSQSVPEGPGGKDNPNPDNPGGGKDQTSSQSQPSITSEEPVYSDPDVSIEVPEGKIYVYFNTRADDVVIDPLIIEPGETISKPFPLRKGYMLRRWLCQGVEFDFSTPITENTILTAQWLERTNLPTFSIELRDEDSKVFPIDSVTRDEYVKSSISIMNGDGGYDFKDLASSFKGRGNGSWSDAKKGWKLKFDKKQSLFGREANKHWVLLACTNFSDGTMLRNFTAFNMAGKVFSNLEYTTNAVWLDLYVNGEYRGVYVLCEHVRVGKGRVNIESKYGVEDTGYLLEYDAYATGVEGIDYFDITDSGKNGTMPGRRGFQPGGNPSGHNGIVKYDFTVHSPDPEDYVSDGEISEDQYRAQVAYIKDYVKRVYTAAITDKDFDTFSELVDLPSLIDIYILHEYYKNNDTGYSSFYMYKKPGGKLYFGPAWDFDGTTTGSRGNNGDATGIFVAGSAAQASAYSSSELLISLYKIEAYRKLVEERYKEITDGIASYYDELFTEDFYAENRYALGRNFVRWPHTPEGTKGGATSVSQEEAEKNWVSECRTLKTWFDNRTSYLNSEWKVNA